VHDPTRVGFQTTVTHRLTPMQRADAGLQEAGGD
jgi:hypothetical protein